MWRLTVVDEEHFCFCSFALLRQSKASELHRDVELFRDILLVSLKIHSLLEQKWLFLKSFLL